ncbi:hypothetical protein NXZ75_15265 [Lysinibacillus sphaericus]|uniref:hypothetical protein n=1 Tax=Lysinibacillus sphaericus TaxID=1421 RepID=UPI00216333CC|nr:hypothetical protein [Lysinibacillus sphaericus]MCS1383568.1 hypothetical protein [Lysinibacillus sphaericus]
MKEDKSLKPPTKEILIPCIVKAGSAEKAEVIIDNNLEIKELFFISMNGQNTCTLVSKKLIQQNYWEVYFFNMDLNNQVTLKLEVTYSARET